jgi:hypothetical protein
MIELASAFTKQEMFPGGGDRLIREAEGIKVYEITVCVNLIFINPAVKGKKIFKLEEAEAPSASWRRFGEASLVEDSIFQVFRYQKCLTFFP